MLHIIHVATMMPLSSEILDEHRRRGKFNAANMENCINSRCKCCPVAILAVGMLAYVFWPHCDGEEKVLATNRNGQSIVSVFKACTSIGTQVSQSIQLVTATGRRKNILVYEPNRGVIGCKGKTFPGDAESSAEWTDSQHIRIAIAVLSSIVEKHETVNDMSVSYELGPVLAEACDWSKSIKGSNGPTTPKADISK